MPKRKRHIVLLIALFALIFFEVVAQNIFTSVQHYTTEDGLADNYISDICQDSKGYIWISTTSGLNRFDGHEFVRYSKERNGLSSNYIEHIFEDKNGLLWIVSRGKWNTEGFAFFTKQINVFDPIKERSVPMHEFVAADFEEKDVRWYLNDQENNVWFSTCQGALYKYDGEKMQLFFQKEVNEKWNGLFTVCPDGTVGYVENLQFLLLDKNGKIKYESTLPYSYHFIYTTRKSEIIGGRFYSSAAEEGELKLWHFNTENKNFQPFLLKDENGVPIKIPKSKSIYKGFKVDAQGRIFKFVEDRFLMFDLDGNLLYDLTYILETYNIPSRSIFWNFGDNDLLWLSSEKGLFSVALRENKFQDIIKDKVYNIYGGLVDDGQGNILINQNGILYLNQDHEILDTFPLFNASEMIKDSSGQIWVGDRFSGVHSIDVTQKSVETLLKPRPSDLPDRDNFYILSMQTLKNKEDLLVGMRQGGLSIFDTKTKQLKPFGQYNDFPELKEFVVNHFYENDTGLWLATNNGMYVMNESDGIIAHYGQSENGIVFNEIYHFHEDAEGVFWLATNGDGLIKWNPDSGEAFQFGHEHGLSHQRVYAVYEDIYGKLWLPSGYGVMLFDKTTQEFITWTKEDGLPFDDLLYHFHHQMPDGRLYLGGGNGGVLSIVPDSFVRPVRPLKISQYLEFDNKAAVFRNASEKITKDSKLHLIPSVSSVQLKVSLFDYINPQEVKYAYKIDPQGDFGGLATEWNFQKDNTIRLNNLSYGNHEVQIMAVGTDNNRTRGFLKVPVFVEKPFYLKTWVLIVAGLAIIGLIYAFFKWRTYSLKQDKKRLEKEVSERTKTISKQKEELETANTTKDRLFAIIGHDLRGPLFNLQGIEDQFNYLLETGQTERLKELGGKMEKTAKYLTDTLNNLLNWSMHNMGTFPYEPEKVYLRKATENIFALFESTADAKRIELQMEVPTDITAFVDKNALSTILRNLVSNAIKFTEAGGTVKVVAALQNDCLNLQVSDTGIGMSAEQIQKLLNGLSFERRSGTQGEKSTGLGLMLVKDLIEQNKGEIEILSKEKEGTTFKLKLPISSEYPS